MELKEGCWGWDPRRVAQGGFHKNSLYTYVKFSKLKRNMNYSSYLITFLPVCALTNDCPK